MSGTDERPPVPRWPAEVLEHEPSHGLFQRLAALNGQISVRSFAESLGLNGRNPDPGQLLDFLEQLPIRNKSSLKAATPIIDGNFAVIGSERLRLGRDWTATFPRVCCACIYESAHYRFWFDVKLISQCPFHGCCLVNGSETERLRFFYPHVGVLPGSGVSLAHYSGPIDPTEDFSRYVAGRLGVVEPLKIGLLDKLDLFEAFSFCEVVGFAKLAKRPTLGSTHKWRPAEERHAAVSVGLDVLKGGRASLLKALTAAGETLQESRHLSSSSPTYTAAWGWLSRYLHAQSGWQAELRSVLDEISASKGIYHRREFKVAKVANRLTSISDLSERSNVTKTIVRAVAVKLGFIDCSPRLRAYFDDGQAEKIEKCILSLVPRFAARFVVGVSGRSFESLNESGVIKPFIRARVPWHDQFLLDDLQEVAVKLPSTIPQLSSRRRLDFGKSKKIADLNEIRLSADEWRNVEPIVRGVSNHFNLATFRQAIDAFLITYATGCMWHEVPDNELKPQYLTSKWEKLNSSGK